MWFGTVTFDNTQLSHTSLRLGAAFRFKRVTTIKRKLALWVAVACIASVIN
jgi:hypothetical protein